MMHQYMPSSYKYLCDSRTK